MLPRKPVVAVAVVAPVQLHSVVCNTALQLPCKQHKWPSTRRAHLQQLQPPLLCSVPPFLQAAAAGGQCP